MSYVALVLVEGCHKASAPPPERMLPDAGSARAAPHAAERSRGAHGTSTRRPRDRSARGAARLAYARPLLVCSRVKQRWANCVPDEARGWSRTHRARRWHPAHLRSRRQLFAASFFLERVRKHLSMFAPAIAGRGLQRRCLSQRRPAIAPRPTGRRRHVPGPACRRCDSACRRGTRLARLARLPRTLTLATHGVAQAPTGGNHGAAAAAPRECLGRSFGRGRCARLLAPAPDDHAEAQPPRAERLGRLDWPLPDDAAVGIDVRIGAFERTLATQSVPVQTCHCCLP